MSERKSVTNLTEAQWRIIRPFVRRPSRRGRPHTYSRRDVIDAVQYVVRTGCQWRMLPHDFPAWKAVSQIFYRWRKNGTWQRIHEALSKKVRRQAGKRSTPSAGIIDSQSVKGIRIIFADSAYGRRDLPKFIQQTLCFTIECVRRVPGTKGFVVLPKRWIVERTFAWLGRSRRHSKDYERNPETSEAMIQISMIHLMLQRLAPTRP